MYPGDGGAQAVQFGHMTYCNDLIYSKRIASRAIGCGKQNDGTARQQSFKRTFQR